MTNYPSNLSDSGWKLLSNYFDVTRSRKYDLREIANGILYLVKTGCQWRMLPQDFPNWEIVRWRAKRNELHKFAVIPKRWVVERSFAWLDKCRRLWKNCERKINNSLQFMALAFLAIIVKRL